MSEKVVINKEIADILETKYRLFHNSDFVSTDPISIPKSYQKRQDIEITAFWTAILSWGNRKTIINSARNLFERMGHSPHEFILNHAEKDRQAFEDFKHRTFQYPDTLCFLDFLQRHYQSFDSLENAFIPEALDPIHPMKSRLIYFYDRFFDHPNALDRTKKHIANPAKGSTCKRLNMMMRWMVRPSEAGVDFGLWSRISTEELMIPLDVHVERVARQLGILTAKKANWDAVEELTSYLRTLDTKDPVKYDFALFGIGVMEKDSFDFR